MTLLREAAENKNAALTVASERPQVHKMFGEIFTQTQELITTRGTPVLEDNPDDPRSFRKGTQVLVVPLTVTHTPVEVTLATTNDGCTQVRVEGIERYLRFDSRKVAQIVLDSEGHDYRLPTLQEAEDYKYVMRRVKESLGEAQPETTQQ